MKVLSLEQVIVLQKLAIAEFGGSEGVRDLNRLKSIIAVQTQHIFNKELYSGVTKKSAALIFSIINYHPFVDGNKRTAMTVGLLLLDINNVRYDLNESEIENFAVSVVTKKLDIDSIENWLKEHIYKNEV